MRMHVVSGKPRKAERYDAVWESQIAKYITFQEKLVMASDNWHIDHSGHTSK